MSLVESIQSLMTPQLVSSLAVKTGISDTKAQSGLSAGISSIMGGLVDKASSPRAMTDLTNLIEHTPDIDDPTRIVDDDSPIHSAGSKLLGFAAPDSHGLINRLSSMLGVGGAATAGLLSTAASLIMGAFRRFSRSQGGLDASTLSSTLLAESSSLRMAFPPMPTITTAREPVETYHDERRTVAHAPRSRAWWLLALVPLALLALWLFNRPREHRERSSSLPAPAMSEHDYNRPATPTTETDTPALTAQPETVPAEPESRTETATVTTQTEPAPAQPGATPPITAQPEPAQPGPTPAEPGAVTPPVTAQPEPTPAQPEPTPAQPEPTTPTPAPDMTTQLDIPANSAEAELATAAQTKRTDWIVLDEVQFPVGSAKIPDDANDQIEHVAEILKANPDVKLELGGFTSQPGSERMNKRLSQARADAVRKELIDDGVEASRLEAKGYGEAQPLEAIPDEVQANRRVAARVMTDNTNEG